MARRYSKILLSESGDISKQIKSLKIEKNEDLDMNIMFMNQDIAKITSKNDTRVTGKAEIEDIMFRWFFIAIYPKFIKKRIFDEFYIF